MSEAAIYIPFPKQLYNDIVRCSNGKLDPALLAADQVEQWVTRSLEGGFEVWDDDRLDELAEIYNPSVLEDWRKSDEQKASKYTAERRPLIWKGIEIAAGSDVRMNYKGAYHYATIKNGMIVDDTGAYTPSEWASKVAYGTSRNAWRDLWFKEPLAKAWVPAEMLRAQYLEELVKNTPEL